MRLLKLCLTALIIITTSFKFSAVLTEAERKYAVGILTETRENLVKKVQALSPQQLAFKADTSSWSVAECVEHIAITESGLFDYSQQTLKVPADPSKRDSVKFADADVLKMITDRSSKFKAQAEVLPGGRYGSAKAALEDFLVKRNKHIKYIQTTSDDLRNHYMDFPFGKVDAFQLIVFMAGHSSRHTAQIDEIMQNPNFPKPGR